MSEQPNYYAIIPANVRYDKRLKANEKLLYAEITALSSKTGQCWATNKYFAELYDVSQTSVSLWIKALKDFGYIESRVIYKEGSKEILNRYLTILKGGIQENLNTPPQENLKDNNTSIEYYKKNNKNEHSEVETSQVKSPLNYQVGEIIKAMESIDPKNKRYYGNTTQRKACADLIEYYTFEKVINFIQSLPEMKQKVAYMPTITTPVQLLDKWQQVADNIQRQQSITRSKQPEVIW